MPKTITDEQLLSLLDASGLGYDVPASVLRKLTVFLNQFFGEMTEEEFRELFKNIPLEFRD